MSVKFLGQFLINQGYITSEQLLLALKEQDDARLGILAVAKGILLQSELEEILQQQRYVDERVGDLAVKNNMMSEEQRDYLVKLHRNDRRRLGEVLVKHGFIPLETFAHALLEFEKEQSSFQLDPQFLPPQHKGRSDMVAMIGMTQKVLLRVGCIPAKIEAAQLYSGPPNPCPLSCQIQLSGDYGGRYVLSCPVEIGRVLETNMTGSKDKNCTQDDLWDALGELCNCVVGAAASALASMGHLVHLSPPKELRPSSGIPLEPFAQGVLWNIHTPHGAAIALME